MIRIETLVIVNKDSRILLGKKKRKFGSGKYNGFGGGVEDSDKDIYDTAIRETEEESGIVLINPEMMGRILFHFDSDEQDHDVYFFRANQYLGIPRETDEMTTKWFNIDNIPYDNMWPDDKYWLPALLSDNMFLGNFTFDSNNIIANYNLDIFSERESFKSALERM